MYWYQFTEEDFERAYKQAKAQKDDTQRGDNLGKAKLHGNLGEYAFKAFLRDFADSNVWTYENREAHEQSKPEYSDYDFDLNGSPVDVKTVSNIMRYDPSGMVLGSKDEPWINIDQDDKARYYVFSVTFEDLIDLQSSPDYDYSAEDYGNNAALLLGWAEYGDLSRETFIELVRRGRSTEGVYFPIRGLHELLWRTDCLPHPE